MIAVLDLTGKGYFIETGVHWTERSGRHIDIGMMDDGHLVGAVLYLQQKIKDEDALLGKKSAKDVEMLGHFQVEADRRKALNALVVMPFVDLLKSKEWTEEELFEAMVVRATAPE